MQIKHTKQSLHADTGDSTMMQPSDWNADHVWTGPTIVDADTSYTINADGSGSYGDIPTCFDTINKMMVGNQAKITVNLNAGIHNISRTIYYTNRYTALTQILGATPLGAFTSSNVSVSGSAGAYTNVITTNQTIDTAVVVPGMYVMVSASGLSTQGVRMWGCHKITAVTSNTVTVLNTNRGSAGPSGTTGLTFYIFTSVIKSSTAGLNIFNVTGGAAMGMLAVNFPALKNIIIEGPATATTSGVGILISQISSMYIGDSVIAYSKVGVSGTGVGMYVTERSHLNTSNRYLTVSNSGDSGITAADQGSINIPGGAIVTGSRVNGTSIGIYGVLSGTINASGMILTGSAYSSFAQYYGWVRNTSPSADDWVTGQSLPTPVNTTPTHASYNMGYVTTT